MNDSKECEDSEECEDLPERHITVCSYGKIVCDRKIIGNLRLILSI